MLHVSHDKPLTIAELIEALRTLPQDLVCTNILTEFDETQITAEKLSGRLGGGKSRVSLIEIRLQPST